jgi:hypothetical protein
MQANDVRLSRSAAERKEKVDAALARLRSLKCHVFELRAYCEGLKELQSEKREAFLCKDCGKLIDEGQEVTLKDSFGNVRGRYHRDCFKAIWLSQNWIFDSSSDSICMSEKGL